MRTSLGFAFVLVTALTACKGSDGGTGGGDDTMGPDASVIDPPAPTRGFQIVSPEITIKAGEEITYCYYFKTPNTKNMVVKKWTSQMSTGSHHMILFGTQSEVQPAGTVSASQCGILGASVNNIPAWLYASATEHSELALPTDDGTGTPLGQEITAGSPAYIQMHYVNATDADMKVHVSINAEAYPVGAVYTKTAPYITFNNSIRIPGGAVGHVETQTCATPAGAKFWEMSTHAHKQAVKTEVRNGMSGSTDIVYTSTDWEHPATKLWMATPFFTFASDKLTYSCTYNNPGTNEIVTGDSAQTNEMCMATGYYFPATKSVICVNGFIVQ